MKLLRSEARLHESEYISVADPDSFAPDLDPA